MGYKLMTIFFSKLGLDREIKTKSISVVVDDPDAERVGPWRKSNVLNHQDSIIWPLQRTRSPRNNVEDLVA